MDETIEQKVIRNVQGHFAVYKTPEVVGNKAMVPNIEWEDGEDIDKFFMFAKNLGAKVIYLSEGEEEDEVTGQTKNSILQIGFLHDGIMHHINFIEDDEEEDDGEEEYEEEDEDVEYEEEEQTEIPQPTNQNPVSNSPNAGGDQFIGGGMSQPQGNPQVQQPQQNNFNQNNF